MADNQFVPPRAQRSSCWTTFRSRLLRRLKQYSGRLATEAVQPWRTGCRSSPSWKPPSAPACSWWCRPRSSTSSSGCATRSSNVSYTAQAFELVPQDLTRRIALRQTVDMVRVTMEFFEEVVPLLARTDEQLTALTVGHPAYSRDLAFAAATAYADAAEARGAWDSRMEANVVDAVVRGDAGPELLSQAAALNWDTTAPATVIVGPGRRDRHGPGQRRRPRHRRRDTAAPRCPMCTAPGWWPSCPGSCPRPTEFLADLLEGVRRRPGGDRPDRADADRGPPQRHRGHLGDERRRRLAAAHRGRSWPANCCRNGHCWAMRRPIAALDTEVMRPLADAGPALTETLDAYLDSGGAIEACARKLFVHPNTVRYRLKRIADFTGRDPTLPRDAYVLRVATTVGHLAYRTQQSSLASNAIPVTPPVEQDLLAPSETAQPGDRSRARSRSRRITCLFVDSYKNIRQGS